MLSLSSVAALQQQLNSQQISSESLVLSALDNIAKPAGEGGKAFTSVYAEQALAKARLSDKLRAAGQSRSLLEGLPVSVKDLFDIKGEVTTAGSVVLKNHAPAKHNSTVVQRLLNAGAIIVGRTNMTEFAFSGLGINPHYGSPCSPWDTTSRRISGGSSSGAGVAVANQMSAVSIGTDTGGSIRIPAAFCGVTGFKPTARTVPAQGVLPLSFSLDSSGPLAATVKCCAITYSILANNPAAANLSPPPLNGLKFAIPSSVVFDNADETVTQTFKQAISKLEQAGAYIEYVHIPEFEQLAYINRNGGLTAAEAWFWHKDLISEGQNLKLYDPRVVSRIMRGKAMSAYDYIEVLQKRKQWIAAVEKKLAWHSALLMPTSPIIAPTIAELEASDEAYYPANLKILRNPTLINFLDGCALSVPCHTPGQAPVGLMVAGTAMQDIHILNIGAAIEEVLQAAEKPVGESTS